MQFILHFSFPLIKSDDVTQNQQEVFCTQHAPDRYFHIYGISGLQPVQGVWHLEIRCFWQNILNLKKFSSNLDNLMAFVGMQWKNMYIQSKTIMSLSHSIIRNNCKEQFLEIFIFVHPAVFSPPPS